jgi:outer membrane protein W
MKNIILMLLFLPSIAKSQTVQDTTTWNDNASRYSFAKTYFGLDVNYFPSYGESQYINSSGISETFQRNQFITPAINIGGIHFWGHADFYVSFAAASVKLKSDNIENKFKINVLTGARYYPCAITENKIRPFIGYKFGPVAYTQKTFDEKQELTITKNKSIFEVGVGFRSRKLYTYAAYNFLLNSKNQTFAVSRNQNIETSLPQSFLNFGVNYTWEVTSYAKKPEYYSLNKTFEKSNSAGLFIAIGPSAAFSLSPSQYNRTSHQFLVGQGNNPTFADVAIGYSFTKADANLVLSYRPYSRIREGYNFKQTTFRNSLVLEAYKFLFDYKGFVPFIGGGLSYDKINISEIDNDNEVRDQNSTSINPVITFGWDIRPSRKGDWWLLRTNLRYTPTLKTDVNDYHHNLHDLEFNFIQFVFYPQRFIHYKNLKGSNKK